LKLCEMQLSWVMHMLLQACVKSEIL